MADNSKKVDVKTTKKRRGRPPKTPKVDFPKTDTIESIILSKPNSSVSSENETFEEIVKNWSDQIQDLKVKITELESQAKNAKKEFQKLEKETIRLSDDRLKLKTKVQRDQDLIFDLETRLENLELDQYSADTPDFFRFLVNIFKADEIVLRTKITKSETQIIQREMRITQKSSELATTWVYRQAYDGVLNTYQKLIDFYRDERAQLGKLKREFIQNERQEENKNLKVSILKDFHSNIQRINEQSRSFATNLSESRINFSDSLNQIKNALPNELDKLVENLIQKKASKDKST